MSANYQRGNNTLIWLNREIDTLMKRMSDLLGKNEDEQFIEISLDVFETKQSLVIVADLPGVRETDFTVTVSGNWIVLEGTKSFIPEDIDGHFLFHRIERRFGKINRKINVPERFDPENARAEMSKGTLMLTIPIREDTPHHRITITKENKE